MLLTVGLVHPRSVSIVLLCRDTMTSRKGTLVNGRLLVKVAQ